MVQTLKILGNHPIRIIGPENIDYREYKEMGFTDDQIMRMHADHFKGIAAYNKMLCAKWFYRTFEDFEYILDERLKFLNKLTKRFQFFFDLTSLKTHKSAELHIEYRLGLDL